MTLSATSVRRGRPSSNRRSGVANATNTNPKPGPRLAVKIGVRTVLFRTDDIGWIEASDKHVRLHVGREVHVVRARMKDMERRLDPSTFVRIHKSVIVNVDHVRELETASHGEYTVTLYDGTRLRSGRVFGDRLKALID